jgi:hypothetical protein
MMTKEAALKLHFSGKAERHILFLTDDQVDAIQDLARAKVTSKIVTYYSGVDSLGNRGYAFFETHIVRTMPETFLVIVNSNRTIRVVDILAFYEPEDYLPPKRWLSLFTGKMLTEDFWVKRGIRHITGATLSTHALTSALRQILAIFEIAVPKEQKK